MPLGKYVVSISGSVKVIKGFSIIFLMVLNVFIGLYVLYNVAGWDHSILNPPDETVHQKYIHFNYPDVGPGIRLGSGPWLTIDIVAEYRGKMLAEKQTMLLGATGTIYPQGENLIHSAFVGAEGAATQPTEGNARWFDVTPPAYLIDLEHFNKSGIVVDISMPKNPISISWDVQGDYYPIIYIYLRNQTNPLTFNLSDYKLHVSGTSEIQQERYAKINNVLTVSVFLFAFVESLVIIVRILPRKWLGEDEDEKLIRQLLKILRKNTSDSETNPAKKEEPQAELSKPAKKHLPPWRRHKNK